MSRLVLLIVELSVGKSKVLGKECFETVKNMFYLALSVCIRVEWIYRRHDVVEFQTTFRNIATSECHFNEF